MRISLSQCFLSVVFSVLLFVAEFLAWGHKQADSEAPSWYLMRQPCFSWVKQLIFGDAHQSYFLSLVPLSQFGLANIKLIPKILAKYVVSRWKFNERRLRSQADKAVTFPLWWARGSLSWGAEINEHVGSSQKQMGIIYIIRLFYWDANFTVLSSLLKRSLELSQHKESLNYLQFLLQACSRVRAGAIYLSVGLAIWCDLANNWLMQSTDCLYLFQFATWSNLQTF